MKRHSSFALVSAIMLMGFASIAVLGLSFFIIEGSRKSTVYAGLLQAFYLAERGVHKALYEYRNNGYFSLGEEVFDSGRRCRTEADDADVLMIDSRNTSIDYNLQGWQYRVNLDNLQIKNATNSRNIVLNRIDVSWNDWLLYVREIYINGNRVWRGRETSPAQCDISNSILVAGNLYDVSLVFYKLFLPPSSTIAISINCIMGDGTNKLQAVHPPVSLFNFSFDATGYVDISGSSVHEGIEVEYNAATGRISGYQKLP